MNLLLPSRAGALRVLRSTLRAPANRGRRARAVLQTVRFQTAGRLFGRDVDVPYASHSRFIVKLDDGSSRRAAYSALPDWDEMRVWQAYLRPSDLFVDVGASVGLYTILAAEIGCVVIAIEPVERSLRHLEANLALNGYRADVVEAALSNEEGICFVAGPDASRQHIVESESVPAGSTATRTVTLDSILAGRYAAGVKIDVEGAERRVLEGGKLALRDQRIGLIQLEWNAECTRNFGETREEVAHLLHVNGYELMRPDPSGVLRLAPDTASGQDMFARPRVES